MRLSEVDVNEPGALELAGEEPLPDHLLFLGSPLTTGQLKLWSRRQLQQAGADELILAGMESHLQQRGLSFRWNDAAPGLDWREYCRIRDRDRETGEEEKMWTTTTTTTREPEWEWNTARCRNENELVEELDSISAEGWEIWRVNSTVQPSMQEGYDIHHTVIARRRRRDPDQSRRDPIDPGAPGE